MIVHPLFFVIHLLSITYKYKVLTEVLHAFWDPIIEIILVLVFFIVILYICVVISYIFYAEYFPDNTCYSLFSCFIISLDQTFKNNGGFQSILGYTFQPVSDDNTVDFYVGRLFFDQIANLILLILIVQAWAGIITDKFGELREGAQEIEDEINSQCVICGKETSEIERKEGISLEKHVLKNHKIWSYIFYMRRVSQKKNRRSTRAEAMVKKMILEESIDWFPYSIKKKDDDVPDEKATKAMLNDIGVLLHEFNNK